MFPILKSPYPCIYGQKENFITALVIGVFVPVFLLVFKPFGMSEAQGDNTVIITIGFGIVSFVVMLVFYFILPKIFKGFYKEKDYTLGKDIVASMVLILLIGLANSLYAQFVFYEGEEVSIIIMFWQTFLVGIFPLLILSIMQHNRQLKINLKASEDIQLPNSEDRVELEKKHESQYFYISGDKKKEKITLNDILYLESEGNYAYLNHLKDDMLVKSLHRTTLKAVESENVFPNVFRCHRSYIVNLDHVIEVKGNAQGLKLTVKDCDEHVPVSKKYIPAFKKYFYQDN